MGSRQTFRLVLIKPSHYDDDGYVIQWFRAFIPSNSLAALYGLALDSAQRKVLGDHVDLVIDPYDETNTVIPIKKIIKNIQSAGAGMVGLVGVQSNQFSRAVDLADHFLKADIPVVIGGFHVSGCMAMLPEIPPDIQAAIDKGITMVAGEAEGHLDTILLDGYAGKLKPVYNYMNDLPNLDGVPSPFLPFDLIKNTFRKSSSFDAGRGCPFQCSFCTIINVQGRKSRWRSADDIEALIRAHLQQGVKRFFITDDDFARNRNWEAILDRCIKIREEEHVRLALTIQVDVLCHKIPRFIEKCARAGVRTVFIGLENINPDSLVGAKKRQNKIWEYRKMIQAWQNHGCLTVAGYILGFPTDTPQSIARDLEIIKRELPLDVVEFFCLTPLPGSEDHQTLQARGVWMDPDMNKYDLEHVTMNHALMSREEWQKVYWDAWQQYYTLDHIETIQRRAAAKVKKEGKIFGNLLFYYGCVAVEGIHPLQGGAFRRKVRRSRRPGLPIEPSLIFYPRRLWEVLTTHVRWLLLAWKFQRIRLRVKYDPQKRDYMDLAITPVVDQTDEDLDLVQANRDHIPVADITKRKPVAVGYPPKNHPTPTFP